jgi:hypothetical protein
MPQNKVHVWFVANTISTAALVGAALGDNDGDVVGDLVGDDVGDVVGLCVGEVDGDAVGDNDGDVVGDLVGDDVGDSVGNCRKQLFLPFPQWNPLVAYEMLPVWISQRVNTVCCLHFTGSNSYPSHLSLPSHST